MKEYYRVQANINLSAIYQNIIEIRKRIQSNTRIMVVVKADAYGHGMIPIVRAIDDIVDAYGVAVVEEGIQLREVGIIKPILILGYTASPLYKQLIEYNIEQTVFNYEMAEQISREAVLQGKQACIHIKIDTGMSRIGFLDNENSVEEIVKISKLKKINIVGVFSHFSSSDSEDKTSANHQLKRFLDFVQKLEAEGITIPIKHISNSAGIIDLPSANLDMVRSGITTYGLYPSDEVNKSKLQLIPSLELKSNIVFVKDLEEGIGIGYGSTYVTNKRTRVATIPVGYGDGYPRQLSSKGRVLVRGKSAPVIGRICMDQFMIDVTHIPDVRIGDVVTLIGKDKDEYISVEEMSSLALSFNYEFVCDLGKRIPRIFYRDGKVVDTIDYFDLSRKSTDV